MPSASLPVLPRRFTLIEMLVVVAIIAILASLLSPSLQKALANARALQCTSLLRNFSRGTFMYATQNDDITPPVLYCTASGYEPHRWSMNTEYLELCGATYDKYEPQNIGADYVCPVSYAYNNHPYAGGHPKYPGSYPYTSPGNSYGKNAETCKPNSWLSNPIRAIRLSRLHSAGNKIDMLDALTNIPIYRFGNPVTYFSEGADTRNKNGDRFGYRHNGRANFVFYDGHSESDDGNKFYSPENSYNEDIRVRHWALGNAYIN